MSNGAQSAKGNAVRATAASGSRGAVTGMATAQGDAPLSELLFGHPMDAGGALEASQISQAQIIERQAETIARLERHAARDQEYRTVTKVKLKEAAQRLKEYRLRVEALMGEVDSAKAAIAKLEGEKKKAQAAARKKPVAVEPKKPEMKAVGVQTPWKKALRTVSVQTMATSTADKNIQVEMQPLTPAFNSVVNKSTASSPKEAILAAAAEIRPSASAAAPSTKTANGGFDAIDAALDFSDDDEGDDERDKSAGDSAKAPLSSLLDVAQTPLAMPTLGLPDAISREIDELEFSSSSSGSSSDDSSDDDSDRGSPIKGDQRAASAGDSKEATSTRLVENTGAGAVADDVAASIDAELASDFEDQQEHREDDTAQRLGQKDVTVTTHMRSDMVTAQPSLRGDALPMAMPLSLGSDHPSGSDPIGDELDAELASSSEEECENGALGVNPVDPPRNADVPIVMSDTAHAPIVVSQSTGTVPANKSIGVRETNELILREKSRTLSLSSSSSSSDGEVSESTVSIQEGNPLAEPSPTAAIKDTIKLSSETGALICGLLVDHERNKRQLDEVAHTEVTATDEPGVKKRKLALPDDTALRSTTPNQVAQNTHTKVEVPRKPPAVGTLAPRDLVAFKAAIALREGEAVDTAYVTRTLGVLVKQAATLLRASTSNSDNVGVADNAHVAKLCQTMIAEHIYRQVPHEHLLEGMIRIFRTPRTRHMVEKSIVQLTSLFQQVLFLRLGYGAPFGRTGELKLRTDMVPEVHHCLLALRDLVVNTRLKNGLVLPRTEDKNAAAISSAACATRPVQSVSHDMAFLAHLAAFYATVCRALDRFDLPLIFLVDILACHPNFKGLYCAHAIAQVDPRVLRQRWDSRGREQQSALRAALVHVLQVIALQSREKQEVVYRESAPSLLSSIAQWIDDPLLASINPHADSTEIHDAVDSFTTTIWSAHIARKPFGRDSDMFDVSKALELLAAVHGDSAMVDHFPVSKFVATIPSGPAQQGICADDEASRSAPVAQVTRLIGAVARGSLRSSSRNIDGQYRTVQHERNYVNQVVQWMLKICPREESCDEELLSAVVSELADLLVGLSADESMCKQRDEWLRKLLQILSPLHLQRLPSQPLRQLRLLVMAARPFTSL